MVNILGRVTWPNLQARLFMPLDIVLPHTGMATANHTRFCGPNVPSPACIHLLDIPVLRSW